MQTSQNFTTIYKKQDLMKCVKLIKELDNMIQRVLLIDLPFSETKELKLENPLINTVGNNSSNRTSQTEILDSQTEKKKISPFKSLVKKITKPVQKKKSSPQQQKIINTIVKPQKRTKNN